jgi:hypothetical protein
MRSFDDAAVDLAIWLGESFFPEAELSQVSIGDRLSVIMVKIKSAVNAISLPNYTGA